MPHLDAPQNGVKPSSRFASLNVFKLKSSSSSDPVPLPPPKELNLSPLNPPPSSLYNKSLFSRSAGSLSPSLSPDSFTGPATPCTPYPPMLNVGLEFGKRSNMAFPSVNGRAATASPAPSASGASLKSSRGGDYLPSPSMDGSTDSSGSCPNASLHPGANHGIYMMNSANSSSYTMSQASITGTKSKKGVFKLASLAKRNRSKKDLSDATSTSGAISRSASIGGHEDAPPNTDGDEGVSLPWNFQHHIHVDEGYIGLPPSWSAALSAVGFDKDEIALIHARRRAAATAILSNANQTTYSTERPASPRASSTALPTISASSSTTLLEPVPRSTSLGKGREHLRIQPPSMYSVTSSAASGPASTIVAPSPAHSPKAPSFSMRSFVSGIKNSLASDSASTKGVGGSRGEGEESDQYVFVDGDGPDEDEGKGMEDETLIEPYPFDSSSVSSHHTHSSRIYQASQDQLTPRTPAFPQIQVQRARSDNGHVSSPAPVPRAPSPLAYSTSLPIPTPPRGYTPSNYSASPLPSHLTPDGGLQPGPTSAPPRTPPRRIYHVANASSDFYEGENYTEPPPAYALPSDPDKWVLQKEKERFSVVGSPPPPSRPIPPLPTAELLDKPPEETNHGIREDQQGSIPGNSNDTTCSVHHIPRTAEEVMDISSYYSNTGHGGDAEVDSTQQARVSSPTPPLVIDKKLTKLATLPPRISFHQESNLEDWSESLFDVIGGKGKRSSVLMRLKPGNVSSENEKRSTIRPMSPLSTIGESGSASATASNSSSLKTVPPSLPDMSFGANLTLGPHARQTTDVVEEDGEQERPEEGEVGKTEDGPVDDVKEQTADVDTITSAKDKVKVADGSLAPSMQLPDDSLAPNASPPDKDLDPPPSTIPPSPKSSPGAGADDLPPSPPPKPKPRPPPLTTPPAVTLAPPRTNIITGISGRSPVNPLFGAKPQPLPIPIPPSQIRAQLRPAPPKPPYPPPTLPLPPLRRPPSQPNLRPPPSPRLPLPPIPSPEKASRQDTNAPQLSPSVSRPSSPQTLHPVRTNPGGRDSDLSMITVTPATIATAKTEVVRTEVASVIDPDAVSLASRQESAISNADSDTDSLILPRDEPEINVELPHTQEQEMEMPDDSLISETSSVSLLRDGPQSKWPAPPPTPVEIEMDSTPRRVSRFRTTSLGRVTQLQAMGSSSVSPMSSHFSRGSADTTSSSASESVSLTTPKGLNGTYVSTASKTKTKTKTKGGLAAEARLLSSMTGTFGGVDVESDGEEESDTLEAPVSGSQASGSSFAHPLLTQLQPHITSRNPTSCFTDLVEIAEGESGSVFAARVAPSFVRAQSEGTERPVPPGTSHVAIKRIPLPPLAFASSLSGDSPVTNKLVSVFHEFSLLKGLDHEHLLLLDGVYVGSSSDGDEDEDAGSANGVDTSLWIRMELMERSLADVIGLVAEGLVLQERLVGRFASDILHGLDYLQRQHIAHRDVRSDNLLVNAMGVVKLADFSNAVRVDRNAPTVSGAVGVIYWQAPEMRAGPYNALKVDIWSFGATVWELAETVPPFSMPASSLAQASFAVQATRHVGSQWPPLTHPEHYSRAFHEFLRLCGREAPTRPGPGELLNTPFIRNACGRAVILQLLSQCRSIEEAIAAKEASVGRS